MKFNPFKSNQNIIYFSFLQIYFLCADPVNTHDFNRYGVGQNEIKFTDTNQNIYRNGFKFRYIIGMELIYHWSGITTKWTIRVNTLKSKEAGRSILQSNRLYLMVLLSGLLFIWVSVPRWPNPHFSFSFTCTGHDVGLSSFSLKVIMWLALCI